MARKQKIQGFEIQEELGQGGFGTVYRAKDPALDRFVALKVLNQTSVELRKKFLQEARVTADIRHPNVVEIHQLIEGKDHDYIVMEYCSGGDIAGILGKPMPVEIAAEVAKQFLGGIQAAHEKGIIHRDLKPQNLLLTENNTVKVTDFGIAGRLDGSTATRGNLGTEGFVAPEQDPIFLHNFEELIKQWGFSDGLLPHGVETDVFAAGTLIWSLLTAKWPPSSYKKTSDQSSELPVSYRLSDPREVNPSVPEFWVDAINRCREIFPPDRFSSITDLYDALGLDGPPRDVEPRNSGDRKSIPNADVEHRDTGESDRRHEYAIGPIRGSKRGNDARNIPVPKVEKDESPLAEDLADKLPEDDDIATGFDVKLTGTDKSLDSIGAGRMSSIAGRGLRGRTGDGGPSTKSAINNPTDVLLKSSDDLYIADFGNHKIRVIDARSNTINTLVGRYGAGFSGDGIICEEAQLNGPSNLALHPDGSLYIADSNNQRIRRIDPQTRVISTVVGTGNLSHWDESVPASSAGIGKPIALAVSSSGTLYFCETSESTCNTIIACEGPDAPLRIVAGLHGKRGFDGEQGPATEAMLDGPTDIALNGDGAIFIADSRNYRIRKVDPATGSISTFAGTGVPGYSGDGGQAGAACLGTVTRIAIDSLGNLWILDDGVSGSTGSRIRKIDSLTNIITTEIGGGVQPASEGTLIEDVYLSVRGLAIHGADKVYLADSMQHRIWQADVSGHR